RSLNYGRAKVAILCWRTELLFNDEKSDARRGGAREYPLYSLRKIVRVAGPIPPESAAPPRLPHHGFEVAHGFAADEHLRLTVADHHHPRLSSTPKASSDNGHAATETIAATRTALFRRLRDVPLDSLTEAVGGFRTWPM